MFDTKFKYILVGMGIGSHGIKTACPDGGCPRGTIGAVPKDPRFKNGYEPVQPDTDQDMPNLLGAVDFDSEPAARDWLTGTDGKAFLYQFDSVALIRSRR